MTKYRYNIVAAYSALVDGDHSPEAKLNQLVDEREDVSRLLAAIGTLAGGDEEMAVTFFREYADQIEEELDQ